MPTPKPVRKRIKADAAQMRAKDKDMPKQHKKTLIKEAVKENKRYGNYNTRQYEKVKEAKPYEPQYKEVTKPSVKKHIEKKKK